MGSLEIKGVVWHREQYLCLLLPHLHVLLQLLAVEDTRHSAEHELVGACDGRRCYL